MPTLNYLLTRAPQPALPLSKTSIISERPHTPPPHRAVIWLLTIGVFLPYTFGDTGKYVVALLFLPAIGALVAQKGRRARASDLFVWTAGLWMVAVKLKSGYLFEAAAEALSFVGSYTLARSFLYGDAAVVEFTRALKVVVVVVTALSVLDTVTGTFFVSDLMRAIFHSTKTIRTDPLELHRRLFGNVVLRAESTFDHPILFGTFCSIAAGIIIFVEPRVVRALVYCGVCLFGIVVSISSGPSLGFVVVLSIYFYDKLLGRFSWRWKALYLVAAMAVTISFALSNNPVTWLLRHTTIDPADGYYRLLIWDSAFDYISLSPMVGAEQSTWSSDEMLGNSIDCVWLVLSLTYGLPMVAWLLLASGAACGVFGPRLNLQRADRRVLKSRTGFSLALFLFIFLGITVHFWGAIWMFWGLCIGIRTSIEEYCVKQWPKRRASPS